MKTANKKDRKRLVIASKEKDGQVKSGDEMPLA